MKQPPKKRPVKDERDEHIQTNARSYALEWVTAITQILTIICIVKGNPAWRGTLSILCFGVAFALFYKFEQYQAKPFRCFGAVFLIAGIGLLIWFGMTA
ncbi:MAG: DUF6442 family protein [Lawsonibacter sp.]|jgi:4-hydroxybenzoate polyprenyltransferase